MDFTVELVSSDLNLCDRQEKFFGNIQMQKNCNQSGLSKFVWLVKMALGLVHASYNMTNFLCTVNIFDVAWVKKVLVAENFACNALFECNW